MKKLKESALRVGDIILTTSPEKVSKAIRKGTKSDISHAMIYVQAHSVIDATGDGVHARNTQRLHYHDDLAIHVYRMGRGLTDEEASRIISYARAAVGSEYSIGEAIQSVRKKRKVPTRKQFCSRLAARAYAEAGIALVEDPSYCTPEELKHSPLLIEVLDVTEAITQAQINAIKAVPDATQRGQDVTNALLKAARERNPNIQDLNDIDKHLMVHPEDDAYMSCALHESGYLTLWEEDLARHPERYDFALMNQWRDMKGVEHYCRMTVGDEPMGSDRYKRNRGGYVAFAAQLPLEYFKLKLELYERLTQLHKQRLDVAKKWLASRSLVPLTDPPALRPHTPEWFAALLAWNPIQAALTKLVVDRTGSVDVCSMCGDDPAKDYRVAATHRALGGVDTFRLCNGCLGIRSQEEPCEPFPE